MSIQRPSGTCLPVVTYLGCRRIIIFMDLFMHVEIFPKLVFLEEGPGGWIHPGEQEEEAGPALGKDNKPSQRVLVLHGRSQTPSSVLHLQGLQQVPFHQALPKGLRARPAALL